MPVQFYLTLLFRRTLHKTDYPPLMCWHEECPNGREDTGLERETTTLSPCTVLRVLVDDNYLQTPGHQISVDHHRHLAIICLLTTIVKHPAIICLFITTRKHLAIYLFTNNQTNKQTNKQTPCHQMSIQN